MKNSQEVIPNTLVTVRPSDNPWFNSDLRKQLVRKNKAHSKAKHSNSATDCKEFRQLRNEYVESIRQAKSNFEEKKYFSLVTDENLNTKRWWNILKHLLGQTNDSNIPPISLNNNIVVDNKEKAESFN